MKTDFANFQKNIEQALSHPKTKGCRKTAALYLSTRLFPIRFQHFLHLLKPRALLAFGGKPV